MRWWRCKECQKTHANPAMAVLCLRNHSKYKIPEKIEICLPQNLGIGDIVIVKGNVWWHHTGEDDWIYEHLPNESRLFYYVVTKIELKNPRRFHLMTRAAKDHQAVKAGNKDCWHTGYVDGVTQIRKVKNPPEAVKKDRLGSYWNYEAKKVLY